MQQFRIINISVSHTNESQRKLAWRYTKGEVKNRETPDWKEVPI